MARSHAKLLAAIWADPTWIGLSARAQRMYMLLLSQPRLTLVGSLDYAPGRWATLANDTTVDDIEGAVADLETDVFVVVDRVTAELVIRSFTRHDLTQNTANSNLLKGLWGAFAGLTSSTLRQTVVDNFPEWIWTTNKGTPPPVAVRMRRSARFEPGEGFPVRMGNGVPGSNPLSPVTSHLSPVQSSSPTATETRGLEPSDDDEAVRLGTEDHRNAIAAGITIYDRNAHLTECINRRRQAGTTITLARPASCPCCADHPGITETPDGYTDCHCKDLTPCPPVLDVSGVVLVSDASEPTHLDDLEV